MQRQDNEASTLGLEIGVRRAELNLKRYNGNDPDERQILALEVKQAGLALAREKAAIKARIASAEAAARTKKTVLDNELERLRAIEAQIKACRLRAPEDGLLMYAVAENARFGAGNRNVIAPGEPVKEGQKLLQIGDHSQMIHVIKVPETFIRYVRHDQQAVVRVDAFPGKRWTGRVHDIATVPDQSDFFNWDVKVFPVRVALAGDVAGLKPGMSAEATITMATAADVLWVPAQALVRAGAERFCYVKSGGKIRKVDVVPGLHNDVHVEIKTGLKEGDAVLRDPLGLLRRLQLFLGAATSGVQPNQLVQLQTVRLLDPDAGARRSWVEKYGLTNRDLHALAALPAIVEAVPLRRFPQELRRLDRRHNCTIVATTPALADVRPMPLEAGRFLSATDEAERRMVVVLGAGVADALLPDTDAVGNTVVLNKEAYRVIGVLQDAENSRDNSVFLPISTYRSRFGGRVIIRTQHGTRRGESVEISDILLVLQSPQDRRATVESARGILQEYHDRADWVIQAVRPVALGQPPQGSKELAKGDLEKLWSDLASKDAKTAYSAMRSLIGARGTSVAYLKQHLVPRPKQKPERLRQLIRDLDCNDDKTRRLANKELEKLGDVAAQALLRASLWNSRIGSAPP